MWVLVCGFILHVFVGVRACIGSYVCAGVGVGGWVCMRVYVRVRAWLSGCAHMCLLE